MSVTQISGLISGLDTAGLIDALVTARSGPITLLQQRQAQKTAELGAWQSFEAILISLKIETERLGNRDLWDDLQVTASDEEHLAAEVASTAELGSYQFFVESLAVAHQAQTQGYSSLDELVGSGTLSFLSTDLERTDLVVEDGTTIADLAAQINEADLGITATMVRSVAGGEESYHLVLTAEETGAEHQFIIDPSGLSGGTTPDFTVFAPREGADAVLRFGGEGGLAIQSSTNTFTDVVAGVDLTVSSIHETGSGESTTITVGRDVEKLEARITELVDRYNAMIDFKNEQFRYDPESGLGRPPLMGSATLTSLVSGVRSRLLAPVAGLAADAAFKTALGIGFTTADDGRISFSSTDFRAALEEDYDAVANLFRTNATFDTGGVAWLTAPDGLDLGDRGVEIDVTQVAARAEILGDTIDLSGGLTIDGTNDTFRITLDGITSEDLVLAHGTYTDGDELAAAIAQAVEDSEDLGALGVRVSFEGSGGSGHLEFHSTRFGSSASIQLRNASSDFASALGLTSVMSVSSSGTDVQGTIDGLTAIGDGRILKLSDEAERLAGISFEVTVETASTITAHFTEGAGRVATRQLEAVTEASTGTLARVSSSIESLLDGYARDIQAKSDQLERRRARLERQYAALEATLGQLQSQSQFVSAQIGSLSATFGARTN